MHNQAPIYAHPRRDLTIMFRALPPHTQVRLSFRTDTPLRMSGIALLNSDAYMWVVHSIKVGPEEQLCLNEAKDPIPFPMIRGEDTRLTFSTAAPGTEILIIVEHRNRTPVDAEFMLCGAYIDPVPA